MLLRNNHIHVSKKSYVNNIGSGVCRLSYSMARGAVGLSSRSLTPAGYLRPVLLVAPHLVALVTGAHLCLGSAWVISSMALMGAS